jgi:hypothetical protein
VITPGEPRIGSAFDLAWEMEGRIAVLQRLHIWVEGREEATYRRGTDTVTDKEIFATVEVTDTDQVQNFRSGRGRASIPSGTMHSFSAANNKVVWVLKVRGHIRRWPDIVEEFPVQVRPQPGPMREQR